MLLAKVENSRDCVSSHHFRSMTEGEADGKSSGTPTAPSRKLRLFGVNLDCGPEPEPETPTAMYGYMHQSPYAAVSAVPSYW